MIGFEYTYISSHEIIEKTKLLTEYGFVDIVVLILLLISAYLTIYYIIPYLHLYLDSKKIKDDKKRRKELARKIIVQRTIEESLAKDLNIK